MPVAYPPLDSLPYLDVSHPDYEAYALTLIEEEMLKMDADPSTPTSAAHYLAALSPLPPSASSLAAFKPLVRSSLEQLAEAGGQLPPPPASNPASNPASSSHGAYRPPEFNRRPTGPLARDVHAWRAAARAAKAHVEGEGLRLMNLELLASFGQAKHAAHLARLEARGEEARGRLREERGEVDLVNARRKAAQDGVGAKHGVLVRKWAELVHKNRHLEKVVGELEVEVGSKRAKTGKE
ncbi:hypothetical protein TeGR_g4523 [Tetraparma gracilis]|uniref:Pre-mRNA-splicing factor SPF27 n=1 Tax=Tetraparma gracilis TaxID=2962635 RepID=A0ABQ6MGL4_9STRA|nr:hypothetical protein TeGR_g4523 [Tetraparma gracilis]